MRNPFLLFTAILIASVASIAQAQPQSPASLVENKTLSAEAGWRSRFRKGTFF